MQQIIDEMKNKSKIALEMQAKQLELQRHDHLIETYKNKTMHVCV
jgi:hypothetical protein